MAKNDNAFRALTRHRLFMVGLAAAISALSIATQLLWPQLHDLLTVLSLVVFAMLVVTAMVYYQRSQPERLRRQKAEQQARFLAEENPHRADTQAR